MTTASVRRCCGRCGSILDGTAVLGTLAAPLDLLDLWDGAGLAVVVDALGGGEPGTVLVVELGGALFPEAIGARAPGTSSHGFGVVEALRLAHVRGTAPRRAVLVGIVGADFAPGVGLSPSVAAAVDRAARLVEQVVGCAPARTALVRCRARQRDHRP